MALAPTSGASSLNLPLPKETVPCYSARTSRHAGRRSPVVESSAPGPANKSANLVPGLRSPAILSSGFSHSVAFSRVVELAAETIERYSLCQSNNERIIVALSGGKDSLILARVLRELGLDARAITIDMGYESGWADEITRLARPLGLTPEIIDVRRPIGGYTLTLQIRRRMDILGGIPTSGGSNVTPCTYCYSVKALALEDAARRHESTKVAFAHHMTDAIASLLKEGLIHIDRRDHGNITYDRENFAMLVDQLAAETAEFSRGLRPSGLLGRIADRVGAGELDTDEPPRQSLNENSSSIEIIRPLFLVDERQIDETKSELRLLTAHSGCGHGATQSTQTPREMVHFRVLYQAHPDHLSLMKGLVLKSVDQTGNGKARARRRRAEFVGPAYKPPTNDLDKI